MNLRACARTCRGLVLACALCGPLADPAVGQFARPIIDPCSPASWERPVVPLPEAANGFSEVYMAMPPPHITSSRPVAAPNTAVIMEFLPTPGRQAPGASTPNQATIVVDSGHSSTQLRNALQSVAPR